MDSSASTNFFREVTTIVFCNLRLATQVALAIFLVALVAPLFIGKFYTVTGEIIVLSKKLDQGIRAEVSSDHGTRFLPPTLADLETETTIIRSLPVIQGAVGALDENGIEIPEYSLLQTGFIQPLKYLLSLPMKLLGSDDTDPQQARINELTAYVLEDLEIVTAPGTNVILISYTHRDADKAMALVNQIMETYLQKRRDVMRLEAPENFLLTKRDTYQRLVADLEQRRVDLLSRHGVVNPDAETTSTLQRLEDESRLVAQLQESRQQNQLWLDYLKTEAEKLGKAEIVQTSLAFSFSGAGTNEELFYVDTEMKHQLGSIAELVSDYNEARFNYTADSPRVNQILAQLREQKRRLELLVANRILEKEQALRIIDETIAGKHLQIAELKTELGRLRQAAAEEATLVTELNAANDAYFRYAQQYEEYRSEQMFNLEDMENVRILSRPVPPLEASSPKPLLVWLLGGVAAIASGLVAALLAVYFSRTFITPYQVQSLLNLPVIAVFDDTDPDPDLPERWTPAGVWKWLRQPPRA